MSQIEDKLGLNRRKLVSLAILLGCDYLPHGIPGVGKETALKLLQCVHGDILDRYMTLAAAFRLCCFYWNYCIRFLPEYLEDIYFEFHVVFFHFCLAGNQ